VLVQAGEHHNPVGFDKVEQCIGEAAQARAPNIFLNPLIQQRVGPEYRVNALNLSKECCTLLHISC